MTLGARHSHRQRTSTSSDGERKLSLGASCLVSAECLSLCCKPLPNSQAIKGYQVAACAIRDDGSDTTCVQEPAEWDQKLELIAWMGLRNRLSSLKSKSKRKIIISGGNKRPYVRIPLEEPATPDPFSYGIITWRPHVESLAHKSFLSTLRRRPSTAAVVAETDPTTTISPTTETDLPNNVPFVIATFGSGGFPTTATGEFL